MACWKCGDRLDPGKRLCPHCDADNGHPNVRRARRPQEVEALEARVAAAWTDSESRGAAGRLAEFEAQVRNSRAVTTRRWNVLDRLINDHQPILTYYQLREAGILIPDGDYWSETREAHDSLVNPDYYRSIHYAVLSLNGRGAPYYGNFHLTWREAIIDDRTTVFEENGYIFNKRLPPDEPEARLGHRATWDRRSDLAVAKLHARIEKDTPPDAFADIIVEPRIAPFTDFLEVHIFGPLNIKALERIVAHSPQNETDLLIWERLREKIDTTDIILEEIAA